MMPFAAACESSSVTKPIQLRESLWECLNLSVKLKTTTGEEKFGCVYISAVVQLGMNHKKCLFLGVIYSHSHSPEKEEATGNIWPCGRLVCVDTFKVTSPRRQRYFPGRACCTLPATSLSHFPLSKLTRWLKSQLKLWLALHEPDSVSNKQR